MGFKTGILRRIAKSHRANTRRNSTRMVDTCINIIPSSRPLFLPTNNPVLRLPEQTSGSSDISVSRESTEQPTTKSADVCTANRTRDGTTSVDVEVVNAQDNEVLQTETAAQRQDRLERGRRLFRAAVRRENEGKEVKSSESTPCYCASSKVKGLMVDERDDGSTARQFTVTPSLKKSLSVEEDVSVSSQSSEDDSESNDFIDDEAVEVSDEVAQAEDDAISAEEVDSSYEYDGEGSETSSSSEEDDPEDEDYEPGEDEAPTTEDEGYYMYVDLVEDDDVINVEQI